VRKGEHCFAKVRKKDFSVPRGGKGKLRLAVRNLISLEYVWWGESEED